MPSAERHLRAILLTGVVLAGCAGSDATSGVAPGSGAGADTTDVAASSTTTSSTTTSSTTSTTTSSTSTTSTTSTSSSVVPEPVDLVLDAPFDVPVEIGRSVLGRPITVIRRGTPGGTVVLAVGVIHGNEAAGVAIIDELARVPVPDGVELWLVRSMNPDGQAIDDRQNANLVDLNRNFPENWDVLGTPGDWQYGGPAPASEPETRTIVELGAAISPDLVLWYHQDLFRIAPGSGRPGVIRTRYAELSGLPVVEITGGTYTGTASQWSRSIVGPDGVGITVELGPTLSDAEVVAHTDAVLAVAVEFW